MHIANKDNPYDKTLSFIGNAIMHYFIRKCTVNMQIHRARERGDKLWNSTNADWSYHGVFGLYKQEQCMEKV